MNYLPGRPYALLNDSVVFQIVYTNATTDEDITAALSTFIYDEAVDCSLYGRELFIGETKLPSGSIMPLKPYPSWVFNEELSKWEAPVPLEVSSDDLNIYTWDEENACWQTCIDCNAVGVDSTS